MADDEVGTEKLIQYLTEAHGKEVELQTALAEHIEIATKDSYKKRLKDHLKETNQHAKLVERRVKKLGGDVSGGPVSKIVSVATKLPATAVKGAGQAIRGTSVEEKQLKNAKTEFFNEHEEIANYTAIEVLATELGDKDTAKMAKDIRRQEERMSAFLEKQIPVLTKAVVRADVPASERAKPSRRRRPAAATSRRPANSKSRATRKTSGTATKTKSK
jgi:ferritin-like metal-binding protein YciE